MKQVLECILMLTFAVLSEEKSLCGEGFTYNSALGKCVEIPEYNEDFFNCVVDQDSALFYSIGGKVIDPSLQKLKTSASAVYTDKHDITSLSEVSNTIEDRFRLLKRYKSIQIAPRVSRDATEMYSFDPTRHFHQRICFMPLILNLKEVELSKSCKIMHNGSMRSDLVFLINISPLSADYLIVFCEEYHLVESLDCPLEKTSSNFSVQVNGSIVVNSTFYLTPSEYLPLNEGIATCENAFLVTQEPPTTEPDNTTKTPNKDGVTLMEQIEFYFDVTGTASGLLCYILIIALYLHVADLNASPGLDTVALCVALFACDCLHLVRKQVQISASVCQYVDMVSHWLLLVGQAWMAVIAVDLSVLVNAKQPSSGRKYFYLNTIITFLLPSMVVAAAVTLQQMSILDFDTMSFSDTACWLKSFKAWLYFYVAPVGFTYLISIVCLAYVVFRMYGRNNCGRLSFYNVYYIALKITSLMLLVEVSRNVRASHFPFVKDKPQFDHILNFVGTVLTSVRGVFFFIIFIFNKSILKVFKKHLIESNQKNTAAQFSIGVTRF